MNLKHLLAGVAVVALMAQPALAQLADVDLDFAKEAAQGGLMEVRLGELAEQQAKSAEVQDFGGRMVEDHGKANDELMQIAQQKGIELPQTLSEDAQETYDDLRQNMGAEFDEAYMDEMVSDHEDDVDAFEEYVEDAEDPDLRSFAEATLPVLREHLVLAEQVQEHLSAASDQEQPAATATATDQPADADTPGWVSIEEVLGSPVVNASGDEVGEIRDVVMKDNTHYAVVSVGGFLGIGEKDVAVPLDQLKLGEDESFLMSKQTEEQLEQMPAYEAAQYQPSERQG